MTGSSGVASSSDPSKLSVCVFPATGARGSGFERDLIESFIHYSNRGGSAWKPESGPLFRSVETVLALDDARNCDISVQITHPGMTAARPAIVDVYSSRTKESLLHFEVVEANRSHDLASPVHNAFAKGSRLYKTVISQRPDSERPAEPAALATAAPSLDAAFWDSVKTSSSPADLQAYLRKFPDGTFADLARARLTALGEAPVRATPFAAPAPGTANFGRYSALVIGINNYKFVQPLKTAINDATVVARLLTSEYGFDVKLLIDPNRSEMLDAFDELRRSLTESDNLLVYYAGHGVLDRDSDRGFWLPVDAHPKRRANWLSNSDIADMVRGARAKHVLVVADSCYAGTLTRTLSVQMTGLDDFTRLAQRRARTALVSGGLEPVEDSGGGNHSVFAKAFLDQLRANTGVVDMSQIFSGMRRQVILSAQQTPQYGDIRQTGHEGGDFIFVRRPTGR